MQTAVLVYPNPNHIDAEPSEPDPAKMANAGECWHQGQRVAYRYTSDRHEPGYGDPRQAEVYAVKESR